MNKQKPEPESGIPHHAMARPLVPASFPAGPAWYVANTYRGREQRAGEEVEGLGFEVFIPVEKYRAKVNSRKTIEKTRVLFTQYLFVYFDIDRDQWGQIARADAVRKIMGSCQTPRAIPDEFIDSIRNAENMGLFDKTTAHLRMSDGDEMEVLDGPFTGLVGKFAKGTSKRRVELLLEVLGGPTRVSFDVGDVRKL